MPYQCKNYIECLTRAEEAYDNQQPDSLLGYLTRIRHVFNVPPSDLDSFQIGLASTLWGFYYDDHQEPDSAIYYHQVAFLEKAAKLGVDHPQVAKSLNNLALLWQQLGKMDIALVYFKEAFRRVDGKNGYIQDQYRYLINIANQAYLRNRPYESLQLLKKASTLPLQDNYSLLGALGNTYMALHQWENAVNVLSLALESKTLKPNKRATLSDNLGNAWAKMHNHDSALVYHQQALLLRKRIPGIPWNELGNSYANLGATFLEILDYPQALWHLEKALSCFKSSGIYLSEAEAVVWENLGRYYLDQTSIPESYHAYQMALSIRDSLPEIPQDERARCHFKLSMLAMMPPMRDTIKGLYHLEMATNLATYQLLPDMLIFKASIATSSHRKHLAGQALNDAWSILKLHENVESANYIETLLGLAEGYLQLHDTRQANNHLISCRKLLDWKKIKNSPNWYRLYARTNLLAVIHLRILNQSASASNLAFQTYQDIQLKLNKASWAINDRILAMYKLRLGQEYLLSLTEPKLAEAIGFPFSKTAIPKTGKHTLFIRYTIADHKLIIWQKWGNKVETTIKEIGFSLEKEILSIHHALREMARAGSKSRNNYQEILTQKLNGMSLLLLPKKLPAGIKEIQIMPDQILEMLPFELLNLPFQEGFLIDSFPVSYVFPVLEKKRSPTPLRNRVIGYSPGFKNDRRGYSPLRYSNRELDGIAHYFPIWKVRNFRATSSHFRQYANKYRFIHLATHGDPDLEAISGGTLLFHEGPRKAEDGQLRVSEIRKMNLRPELVVLSACEASLGNYLPGRGMNSLARAFLESGAKSVVTSLWQVDDQQTATFMGHFYAEVAAGKSKNNALRDAKLRMRQKDPYFWAPFVLLGDTRRIR